MLRSEANRYSAAYALAAKLSLIVAALACVAACLPMLAVGYGLAMPTQGALLFATGGIATVAVALAFAACFASISRHYAAKASARRYGARISRKG